MAGIQYTADSKEEASHVQTEPQRLEQRDHRGRVDRHYLLHRLEQAQQENSAKRARPLLPESAVVLTWQGPSWQIERIGQGWRSAPDLGFGSAQLAARIEAWQGWLLPPASPCAGTPVTSRSGSPDRAIRWKSGSIGTTASLPLCCPPRPGSA